MTVIHALYGRVPPELADDGIVEVPDGAVQCGPTVPPPPAQAGASGTAAASGIAAAAPTPENCALSDIPATSLASVTVHAPANTIERRHVLALALRALRPGGTLTVFAAKAKGGTRLADEIEAFGSPPHEISKRHHRIVTTTTTAEPAASCLDRAEIDRAIADGEPRIVPGLRLPRPALIGQGANGPSVTEPATATDLWSMPGLFNWDKVDPGSALLIAHMPKLVGRGIDLGCGIGILAKAVLSGGACTHMTLADIDARALDLASRNVSADAARTNAVITTAWVDVRTARDLPTGLDFVVMNPPFHDGPAEDRTLGQAFITRALQLLRPGGVLWMTANRHLPYEEILTPLFENVKTVAQSNGFKVTSATKPMKAVRRPPRVDSTVSGAFGRKSVAATDVEPPATATKDTVTWNGVEYPTFEADAPKGRRRPKTGGTPADGKTSAKPGTGKPGSGQTGRPAAKVGMRPKTKR